MLGKEKNEGENLTLKELKQFLFCLRSTPFNTIFFVAPPLCLGMTKIKPGLSLNHSLQKKMKIKI